MKKFAALIAIEKYTDPDLAAVAFARHDAEALSAALAQHGFAPADQLLLIDAQATKTSIESKLKKTIKRLKEDDVFCLFFVGAGYTSGGQWLLAAYDTQPVDEPQTGIALEWILAELRRSAGQQATLLLDVHGGQLSPAELEKLLAAAPHVACFFACGQGEDSYASGTLKHGIWNYHLLQAFNGDAPAALQRGLLTANSLQAYLASETPRTLRGSYSDGRAQTPWSHTSENGDYLLADLRTILQQRQAEASQNQQLTVGVSLLARKCVSVKNLAGWKKTFRLPDRVSDSSQTFIAQAAESELKQDLDTQFAALKAAFELTRRDLIAAGPEDGGGSIGTPYFQYSIKIAQHPEHPSEAVWSRTVDGITDPQQVVGEAFSRVFDGMFDSIELALPQRIDLEAFIDMVEAARAPDLKIQYDREVTYCDLHLKGVEAHIRLTPQRLRIAHDRRQPTQLLIQSFNAVKALVFKSHLPAIGSKP